MSGMAERLHVSATLLRPVDRLNALLDAPDPGAEVAKLSPMAFYDLYHAVGAADAGELVALAEPEQVQACLDLDIWRRDRLVDEAMAPWVENLLAAPDEQFARLWHKIDPEVTALYLHRNVRLYVSEDRNDEVKIPETESPNVVQSPDMVYWVAYPEDPDKADLLRRLVDRLYAVLGVEHAWSVLEGMKWEFESDLEETAYRFRTARIREYGFMPPEEACACFAPLNLAAASAEILAETQADLYVHDYTTTCRLDNALLSLGDKAEETYFGKILAKLADVEPVRIQLFALAQRIATADGYQPHEAAGYEESMLLAVADVNLGLEYLARGEDEVALRLLRHVSLLRLFGIGHNVTLQLQHKAKALAKGQLSIIDDEPFSLLTVPHRDALEGLLLARPRPSATALAPFLSMKDIAQSAGVIADIATRELFFAEGLHKTKDDISLLAYSHDLVHGVEGVSLDNVAATYLVHRACGSENAWCPLKSSALPPRAMVIEAVSPQAVLSLFKGELPRTATLALERFAHQLEEAIAESWPEQVERPDERAMSALLLEEE